LDRSSETAVTDHNFRLGLRKENRTPRTNSVQQALALSLKFDRFLRVHRVLVSSLTDEITDIAEDAITSLRKDRRMAKAGAPKKGKAEN